ncbi:MAG: recombinase family protein [Clostridiales bacterium]|nr:recombinase family protein [Clostridiales bacterium]
MKTAVIYARYSSDNQTEQSIEGQLRVCQDYAKRNDILILNTYIDRAMTGTNDNRPDFQQMIKDSSNKDFQYIIVYRLDRFSRNKYETAKYKKILKDNGVKLLSAMENIPDTPEGIILESLLEGMAEYYSAELAQKVKRGMKETRLKGHFTGGLLLYGYKLENKKILIDEEKAEVVRYIYKQYSYGTYVKDIILSLTEKRIFNKGKPFTKNTIYNILQNEKYIGIYRYKDEVYENMYPPIVPNELFEKVKKKRRINKDGKRSVKAVYMFRNKMKCGYCGKPISAETGTSQNGIIKRYYKCLGRKSHNGCIKENVRKEDFEELIINSVLEVLNNSKNLEILTENILKAQSRLENNNNILKQLLKEKKECEKILNNIMTAVEQGLMNNTTIKRMNELEIKITELEKDILIENSKSTKIITKEDIQKFYIQALKLEPQMLINYLVKEIRAFNDKIEITFNSPIKNSPNNKGYSFLFITKQIKHLCLGKVEPKTINIKIEMFV